MGVGRGYLLGGLFLFCTSCGLSFKPGGGPHAGAAQGIKLTIEAPNGSVIVDPQKQAYEAGETVELTAVPNDGFYFLNWESVAKSLPRKRSLTLTQDTTVKANFFSPTQKNQFYVATNGTPAGNGSMQFPWDLQTALSHPAAVKPGDIIWVRGGFYTGRFVNALKGEPLQPIVVRGYPNERAILDGNIVPDTITLLANLPATSADITVPVSNPNLVPVGSDWLAGNEVLHSYAKNGSNVAFSRGWNASPVEAHTAGDSARKIVQGQVIMSFGGENTWLWDLEIMDSSTERYIAQAGSNPYTLIRGGGVSVLGKNLRLINCYIHDTAQGLGSGSNTTVGEGMLSYGNLILNNGWTSTDRHHGHGMYVQNGTPGYKYFENNVVGQQFGVTLQMYGSSAAPLDRFHWDGNIFTLEQVIFGGGRAAKDLTIQNTLSYGIPMGVGYDATGNTGVVINDNYFDGLFIKDWTEVEAYRNTFFKSAYRGIHDHARIAISAANPATYDYSKNRMDYNLSYSEAGYCHIGPRFVGDTVEEWRQHTGYEANGQCITLAHPPQNRVFLRRNDYDKEQAWIVIYNWERLNSVTVDLNGFLSNGNQYELRQVYNYDGEVETGNYSALTGLTISMQNRQLASAIGYTTEALAANPFPEFGVFLIRKK